MDTINRFDDDSSSGPSRPQSQGSSPTQPSFFSPRRSAAHSKTSSIMAVNDLDSASQTPLPSATSNASSISQDDPDTWFQRFRDEVEDVADVSHSLPTEAQLATAGNIMLYDADGNSRPFHQLYKGSNHQGHRQLIIFLRHFYCPLCQAYVRTLIDSITPSTYFALPIPTTITLISCGRPSLLTKYAQRTQCPFRMYVDPSRKLYKTLGMPLTWSVGRKKHYCSDSRLKVSTDGFAQMFKAGWKDGTCGGHFLQVGGEFLFEGQRPIWCRRMKFMRDHTGVATLEKIISLETEELELVSENQNANESSSASPELKQKQDLPMQAKSARPYSGIKLGRKAKLLWDDTNCSAPPKVRIIKETG